MPFCMPITCNRQIDSLDLRQRNLTDVPHDIDKYRALEELLLSTNQIKVLPKNLFRLNKLRFLDLSENDITSINPEIGNLQNLVELRLKNNAISDIPEQLAQCRSLMVFDLSSNPITRLPEAISQCSSLTFLRLNDVSLTQLPGDIGSITNLRSLEVRDNLIRAIPPSITHLTKLQILDLGQNEFDSLPEGIGNMESLKELYIDINDVETLPEQITKCRNLEQLDANDNKLHCLPEDFGSLDHLTDLNLSMNFLQVLPSSIGRLKHLKSLKLDKNSLTTLTEAIGNCENLTELHLSENLLSELPASIGKLQRLIFLNVDKNYLECIPTEIGNCGALNILSARENKLSEIPMEIGKCSELGVLDLCSNRLINLPFTVNVLFKLKALWLSENQAQPIMKLDAIRDVRTGNKVLTCYLLPQQGVAIESDTDRRPLAGSGPSANCIGGPKVHFGDQDTTVDEEKMPIGNFERHDTPKPKSHKDKIKNNSEAAGPAHSQIPAHNTGSAQIPVPVQNPVPASAVASPVRELEKSVGFSSDVQDSSANCRLKRINTPHYKGVRGALNGGEKERVAEIGDSVVKRVLIQRNDPVGLGLSIAGGLGSSPYKDDDQGLFVSKVVPGGSADLAGLRVGDKILRVNATDVSNVAHDIAVTALKEEGDVGMVILRSTSPSPPAPAPAPAPAPRTPEPTLASTPVITSGQASVNSSLNQSFSPMPPSTMGKSSSASVSVNQLGDTSSWNGKTEEVELRRDGKSLGLSIVGGSDHASHPFGVEDPGVFISKIAANSPADRSQKLRIGDRILAVNNIDVSKAEHKIAVEALQTAGPVVKICVTHDPQPSGLKEVMLIRNGNSTLGLSIHGGVRGPGANPNDPSDEGIFIERVDPGSTAEKAGLTAGHRIIEVNGDSLLGCCQQDAAKTLMGQQEMRLLICNGYNKNEPKSVSTPSIYSSGVDENGVASPLRSLSPIINAVSNGLPVIEDDSLMTSSINNISKTSDVLQLKKVPPPVAPKPTLRLSQSQNVTAPSPLSSITPETLSFSNKLKKFEHEIEINKMEPRQNSAVQLPIPEKKSLLSADDAMRLKEANDSRSKIILERPESPEKQDDEFYSHLLEENPFPNYPSRIVTKKAENRAKAAGLIPDEEPMDEEERRIIEKQKRSQWRADRLKSLDNERAAADALMSRLQLASKESSITE